MREVEPNWELLKLRINAAIKSSLLPKMQALRKELDDLDFQVQFPLSVIDLSQQLDAAITEKSK